MTGEEAKQIIPLSAGGTTLGIMDQDLQGNPVKDDTYIFVPYCTQDLHFGNATVLYHLLDGTNRTVQHRGLENGLSVMKYLFREIPQPDRVLVTGCSAGGYAAALFGAYAMEQYRQFNPATRVVVVADSSVGVIGEDFARHDLGEECCAVGDGRGGRNKKGGEVKCNTYPCTHTRAHMYMYTHLYSHDYERAVHQLVHTITSVLSKHSHFSANRLYRYAW
jgi:hypothetical protein